jgi:hypothetical protein
VRTGGRWIRGLISSWALRVDSLVNERQVESFAMMGFYNIIAESSGIVGHSCG